MVKEQNFFPGDVVTEDATIYIFADAAANGLCTTESSFTVTVYETPTVQVNNDTNW